MEEKVGEDDRPIDPSIEGDFSHSEISSLTRVEEQEMKAEAKAIGKAFLALYGKYMPSQTKEKVLETPNKFRVKFEKEDPKLKQRQAAGYLRKDRVIIINRNYLEWMSGNLSFTDITRLEIFSTVLAMEEAHRLENHNLAGAFLECGASYYAREVLKHLGRRWVSESFAADRADLYEKVIAEVKEDGFEEGIVHRLFFGLPEPDVSQPADIKYLVYSFFDKYREEISNLMPEWEEGRK